MRLGNGKVSGNQVVFVLISAGCDNSARVRKLGLAGSSFINV